MKNIFLSFDIEDGIALSMMKHSKIFPSHSKHIEIYTNKILDTLNALDAKGTFFILGSVAQKYPNLVKKISNNGHEIASHGFNHIQFNYGKRHILKEELVNSKQILENLIGKSILGHRAPVLSIKKNDIWAFDMIYDSGYIYDSSALSNSLDTKILTLSNGLKVFPVNGWRFSNYYLPIAGGGYLRIIPSALFKYFLDTSLIKNLNIYLHPYEFDTDFENLPQDYLNIINNMKIKGKIKLIISRFGRKSLIPKLELLKDKNEKFIFHKIGTYLNQ